MSTDHVKPIRRPEDIANQSMNDLVERWSNARMRTFLANHAEKRQPDAEDLFAELAYGTLIAHEATCGRWCTVAQLLRAGAVASWAQIGAAMGLTESAARDGFQTWISGQFDLRRHASKIGFTAVEATELRNLAEAEAW